MKVVLTQINVGSKFRFMPSGANGTYISNYPRDGWLTESAARKWAKANGHEIVKVEKVAGNGEKIHRIEYTYKDRFGKTKKQTSELVGKDVEPLKKRIVEGLTRNGDKLISFGKITAKDSVEDYSVVKVIAEKYAIDSIFITSKGFANEKGLLKRDTRKGLKPFEVTFFVKGKDGRPLKTGRSKMAASIEEAKRWAQAESKKYNGVTKIEVTEFKDSADDFASDASVATFTVKSNRNGSKYGYIEKICKTEAEAKALVDKLKKDGLVAMYKKVMYRDSADTIDRVKAKYCLDENFSKTFDSKEKAMDFMNTLNKKYKDKLTGRAFVQALVKPKGSYAVIYFAKSKIGV